MFSEGNTIQYNDKTGLGLDNFVSGVKKGDKVGITLIVQRAVEIVENGTQNIVSNFNSDSLSIGCFIEKPITIENLIERVKQSWNIRLLNYALMKY